MLTLVVEQSLSPRLTLVQKLGLDSRFLQSCLVETEELLHHSRYQRALVLVRGRGENQYRSILDFLVALHLPAMRPAIVHFYDDEGPRLLDMASASTIAALDDGLAGSVRQLAALHGELLSDGAAARAEVVDAYLDLVARPALAAAFAVGETTAALELAA